MRNAEALKRRLSRIGMEKFMLIFLRSENNRGICSQANRNLRLPLVCVLSLVLDQFARHLAW